MAISTPRSAASLFLLLSLALPAYAGFSEGYASRVMNNPDGLPVGFQIVGPRLREDLVLEAAAAYAAASPEHFARPEIDLSSAAEISDELVMTGISVREGDGERS